MYAVFYRTPYQTTRQILANNQRAIQETFETREDALVALKELAREEFAAGWCGRNYEIFEVAK